MGIARLFTQSVSVETYLGQTSSGPSYNTATAVACFINSARKLVRDKTGAEVISETTLYAPLADFDTFTVGSKVTVNGRKATVLCVYRRDSAGPASAYHSHIELT